jgi:HEPN domain-containing protein
MNWNSSKGKDLRSSGKYSTPALWFMSKTNPWLIFARDDLETLDALEQKHIPRVTCFHSQQLAEKTLKALLFDAGIPVPRTHDLIVLAGVLKLDLPVTQDDLQFLSSVYIETRYPPDLGLLPGGEPTREDAARATQIARALYHHFRG